MPAGRKGLTVAMFEGPCCWNMVRRETGRDSKTCQTGMNQSAVRASCILSKSGWAFGPAPQYEWTCDTLGSPPCNLATTSPVQATNVCTNPQHCDIVYEKNRDESDSISGLQAWRHNPNHHKLHNYSVMTLTGLPLSCLGGVRFLTWDTSHSFTSTPLHAASFASFSLHR